MAPATCRARCRRCITHMRKPVPRVLKGGHCLLLDSGQSSGVAKTGQQLAAFFRNNPKLAGIPIVLLTGQENKAAATTTDLSVDAFLYKPVKAEELTSCIENCLKKH